MLDLVRTNKNRPFVERWERDGKNKVLAKLNTRAGRGRQGTGVGGARGRGTDARAWTPACRKC